MSPRSSKLAGVLGVALSVFTIIEVNRPLLTPHSQLVVFATFGIILCLLYRPLALAGKARILGKGVDLFLIVAAVGCGVFLVTQTERSLADFRLNDLSLGNRAGRETLIDIMVGVTGIVLVLETTRRVLGWALPILSLVFLGYAILGSHFPDWMFPHRGYSISRIVSQTFLQSQGVFGIALSVMFMYVFLFVIFGALLQVTGATEFIINFAQRLFRNSPGAPAKVSVVSSGLMGSLSGSAVANTVTTGTFTIPMMRASGFPPHIAGAVEAAASTGGALVPPVMGAGAYMMLEMISPTVTYLEIIRAALIPGILYYLSLFFIVHFYAKRVDSRPIQIPGAAAPVVNVFEGFVFAGALVILLVFLLVGYTPFRAVTLAMAAAYLVAFFNPRTRVGLGKLFSTLNIAAKDVVTLICASACVGIVLGVVTLTGIGTRLPALIMPLADGNLLAALGLIMTCSIVLGMGLPSSVCYLLMATLMGPVLNQLGVVPLAAHLFIFYFGMMSMVTPPVALAAYAAASIAGADVMKCSFAAFRFALVGFTLPFIFVYRPELLLLTPLAGEGYNIPALVSALLVAVAGIVAFAAGISGYLFYPVKALPRTLLFVSAALLLVPGYTVVFMGVKLPIQDLSGVALLVMVAISNRRHGAVPTLASPAPAPSPADAPSTTRRD